MNETKQRKAIIEGGAGDKLKSRDSTWTAENITEKEVSNWKRQHHELQNFTHMSHTVCV